MKKITGAICLAILVASIGAHADEPSPESKAAARALYERGAKHFRGGDLDQAAEEFKSSYDLYPVPETLFNLAQTHRLLKHYDKAIFYFRQYLATAQLSDRDRDSVEQRIAEIQRLQQQQEQQQHAATASPITTAQTEKHATPDPHARQMRLAGIGTMAAGGALIILGGVFYAVAKSANDSAGAGGMFHYDEITKRNGFEDASIASFVIGGAAAVAGVALYAVGRKHAMTYSLAPTLSPGRAGASLRVQF